MGVTFCRVWVPCQNVCLAEYERLLLPYEELFRAHPALSATHANTRREREKVRVQQVEPRGHRR